MANFLPQHEKCGGIYHNSKLCFDKLFIGRFFRLMLRVITCSCDPDGTPGMMSPRSSRTDPHQQGSSLGCVDEPPPNRFKMLHLRHLQKVGSDSPAMVSTDFVCLWNNIIWHHSRLPPPKISRVAYQLTCSKIPWYLTSKNISQVYSKFHSRRDPCIKAPSQKYLAPITTLPAWKRTSPTTNRPPTATSSHHHIISLASAVHERVAILGVSSQKGLIWSPAPRRNLTHSNGGPYTAHTPPHYAYRSTVQ